MPERSYNRSATSPASRCSTSARLGIQRRRSDSRQRHLKLSPYSTGFYEQVLARQDFAGITPDPKAATPLKPGSCGTPKKQIRPPSQSFAPLQLNRPGAKWPRCAGRSHPTPCPEAGNRKPEAESRKPEPRCKLSKQSLTDHLPASKGFLPWQR